MARRKTTPRDADLDERPFGDSHFGPARRELRSAAHPLLSQGPRPRKPTGEAPAAAVYAWHEGCFDDVSPRGSHVPRHGGRKSTPLKAADSR